MFYWDQYYLIDSKDYFKISFLLTVFLTWLSPEAQLPTRQNYDIRRKTCIRKHTKSDYFFLLRKDTKSIRTTECIPHINKCMCLFIIFSVGNKTFNSPKVNICRFKRGIKMQLSRSGVSHLNWKKWCKQSVCREVLSSMICTFLLCHAHWIKEHKQHAEDFAGNSCMTGKW